MKVDLDIIIPAYNAKNDIHHSLMSIALQESIYGFHVYIVNDKSKYDYHEEVEYFKQFYDIHEITLEENLGPGGARREGINRTSSKYIMFIDSDDLFFSVTSIHNIYNYIVNGGYDVVVGNFFLERNYQFIVKSNDLIWLHGKIYRRGFLDEHNINFNTSRANEDNGFNRLIYFIGAKIGYYDSIIYLYKQNENSLTRKNNAVYNVTGLKGFVYNMVWAIEEALKRGVNSEFVPHHVCSMFVAIYYDYISYKYYYDIADDILDYSKDLLPYLLNYRDVISQEELDHYLKEKEETLIADNRLYDKSISFDDFVDLVIRK